MTATWSTTRRLTAVSPSSPPRVCQGVAVTPSAPPSKPEGAAARCVYRFQTFVSPWRENGAVVTILLSAAVGALVVVAQDRLRWKREDRLRWVSERREAYGAFRTAVRRWDHLDHEAALAGEIEEWYDAPADDVRDA